MDKKSAAIRPRKRSRLRLFAGKHYFYLEKIRQMDIGERADRLFSQPRTFAMEGIRAFDPAAAEAAQGGYAVAVPLCSKRVQQDFSE